MKKIISLLFILSFSVLLGACSDSPETIYDNHKYGFSINIPGDFAEAVRIKEEGNVLYFVDKETQDKYTDVIMGVVARIEIYDKKEFTKENLKELEEIYNLKYLGENENYYFGWALATDVQIPPGSQEELHERYLEFQEKFKEIIKTFKLR